MVLIIIVYFHIFPYIYIYIYIYCLYIAYMWPVKSCRPLEWGRGKSYRREARGNWHSFSSWIQWTTCRASTSKIQRTLFTGCRLCRRAPKGKNREIIYAYIWRYMDIYNNYKNQKNKINTPEIKIPNSLKSAKT